MGMATIFGGLGNVNSVIVPVLWLGTFAPQVGKALIHAGAAYYNMYQ